MSRNVLVAMTALVCVLPRASAEEPVERISLEQALRMFEENNLELRLAAAERDRALGLAQQSRAHPNPAVELSHEGLSRRELDYSESYFTLSQLVERPARRAAKADRADEQAAALEATLDAERRRLAFEVKRAFLEAAAAEERMAVVEIVLAVFRTAETSGRARLREGDLSGYDARRLRIERARYENAAASAEIDLETARLTLASLIVPRASGDERREIAPAAAPAGAPPSLRNLDENDAVTLALERRSDVRSAEAQIAAAEASVRYVSSYAVPDVTLRGGYKRQSDGFNGYLLAVDVPLPIFDRGRGDVAAARAGLRAETARLDLTRRAIDNDVRRAFAAHASVSERNALVRESLLTGVDDLLRIARVSYSEGEMTLLELLDAAEAFLESQIMESRLKTEHWIRYYDLERAMGGTPSAATVEEH